MKKYTLALILILCATVASAGITAKRKAIVAARNAEGESVSYIMTEGFDSDSACYSGDETFVNC